jgi:peptide/nickel transport system ATP-binding protein
MSSVLLEVDKLSVDFRLEDGSMLHAVKGVSFSVPEGGSVALVGESGSGKSVTALAALGLLPRANARVLPGSSVRYRGRELLGSRDLPSLRGAQIAMVFQEPMTSLNPVFSVGYQLSEVLRQHLRLDTRAARARAIELLEEVGIPEPARRIDAYPHQLSGGQQQRVMIAMAIAGEPKLLIADEPTTALDVTVQRQVIVLIEEIRKRRGMALLFITHDLSLVADVAEHVVVMRDGEVREQGAVREIFGSPRDAYTRALLACRPRLDRRPLRLPVVEDFLQGAPPRETGERTRGVRQDDEFVLEARGVSRYYAQRDGFLRTREFKALHNASFRLARGRTLGIVGESGSGKTTLALTLMCLTRASGGEVLFGGRDLTRLPQTEAMRYKRRMQIVFQNPYASLNPRFTVARTLVEPMTLHGVGAGAGERESLARELLQKVGLPESAFFKYPHELSGGQRQRIAIARCLSLRPEVLICDEAVSALDLSVQAQLLNLLQDLQDEFRLSYVFISHDLAVVRHMSDEVLVMKDGEIVEMANADALYANPRHPYTRQLLAAVRA